MKIYITALLVLISIASTAQDYTIENNEVKLISSIQFKNGSDELLPQSDIALRTIKKYLDDKSYITTLRIESHTNNNDQQLSENRAKAIAKKLIVLGVDCKRLIAVGFGNTKPIVEHTASDAKTLNERIVFANAALKNRPIGGMPLDGGGRITTDICIQ